MSAFEAWMGPASRSMHRDSAPEAVRLMADIHHLYAAFDAGYINAERVREELLALLNNIDEFIAIQEDVFRHIQPRQVSSSSSFWVPAASWALPAEV